MTGKHRRPHREGADALNDAFTPLRRARNLAATAAVLTAGALPLAAAGSAFAQAAPAAGSPQSALPLASLPLPLGLDAMAGPVQGAVPLAGTLTDAVTTSVGAGDLPVGGLLAAAGSPAQQARAQTREAVVTGQAAAETADLATKTTQLTSKVTTVLPVAGLVGEVAPAMAGGPAQLAPTLLQDGAVGTLTGGFGGKSMELTDGVVGQLHPAVAQLHQQGVPTVGDITTSLSQAKVPVFGTVGGLTAAVPVSEMLGNESPVLGTVGAASGL